jgi:two-component system, NtrC family, response regulator GlrR
MFRGPHGDGTEEALPSFGFEEPAALAKPRIGWTDPDRGARTETIEAPTTVGSAPDAGIVVTDRTVSRLHAELEPTAEGLWVRDLGSKNGTYIDGVRVQEARAHAGARLRLGGTDLVVSYGPAEVPRDLWPEARFGPLVGGSVVMRRLFATLARVAASDSSVLLRGETGTGKELAARAIHDASGRHEGPFVVLDCAGLPETLLESELFGHAKGAFTGAVSAREGAFEAAHGGTIFLDEIGELTTSMQPKLLRVLESRTVRRVGETAPRPIDVRIISATHRDLRTMVNQGAFREDLYFRLAVLPVMLPALRERLTDIPMLLNRFFEGRARKLLSVELLNELQSRPWLGNVRELRNFAERALAVGASEAMAMSERAFGVAPVATAAPAPAPPGTSLVFDSFDGELRDFRERWMDAGEKRYLEQLLARHGGNASNAAAAAGVNRTYIYRLLRKHGL